jgi:predicted Zn-dependent peptidase
MSVEVTTLPSGLRVVTHRMDTVETVSLGIWVDVGTRHEAREINGVAHMLEHMVFKGTKTRSARAIAEEIEAVGGQLNAHTSREFTAFHSTVLKADVALAVELLADILQNSVFDEAEIARERVVIAQEIGEAADIPDDVIFDSFQETAYPGQPLGRPVLGKAEIIARLGRPEIVDYLGRHYVAPRMVVSAAGQLDHAAFVAAVAERFATLPSRAVPNGIAPARYEGGEFREVRDLEQVHLVLGFEGINYADPDFFAVQVLSTLLGGGMSSRLFQEVRESRGLAYTIYSWAASYSDTGLFGVYAGTGEAQLGELVPLVCAEMMKVAESIGAAELARARAQMKAGMLMSLESTYARCEQLARQLHIFGRPLENFDIIARIDAVDETAVKRVASRIVSTTPTLSALGPVEDLESYEKIAARFA